MKELLFKIKLLYYKFIFMISKDVIILNKNERQVGFTTYLVKKALENGGYLVVSSMSYKKALVLWYLKKGNMINNTTYTKEDLTNHIITIYDLGSSGFRGRINYRSKMYLDNSVPFQWYNENKELYRIDGGFINGEYERRYEF